jgi:hypothetical protein
VRFLAASRAQRENEPRSGGREGERPGIARRVWLTAEMMVFFVLTPIGMYSLLYEYRVPLFEMLPPVFLFFIVFLTIDRSFSWRDTTQPNH